MEGLQVAQANLTVYIHPSRQNQIRRTILQQLSSLLFTYNEKFDGVLLAFEVRSYSKSAKILPGLIPYFGVKLDATLFMFSPKPGMAIDGKVVKLTKESIHVTVLGFCSAAIMLEDIRDEFKYKKKKGDERYASKIHKRHTIRVETVIRFTIKSLDEELLHISGSLLPKNTGSVRWLVKHSLEDDELIDSSQKNHKLIDVKEEPKHQHPGLSNDENHALNGNRPHKSRKRKAED